MQNKTSREIALSGILTALGIIIPVFFHAFGAGPAFSPMHIPVLIAGFTLRLPFAAAVGFITPVMSFIATGMPPVFPILPYMFFELPTYSVTACIMFKIMKKNVYFSLIISMLAGRIVAGIVVWILVSFFGARLAGPVAFIFGSITSAIPGIIVQLIIIPGIIVPLKKSKLI